MAPPNRPTNSSISRTGSASAVNSESSCRLVSRKERAVMVRTSDTGGLRFGSAGGAGGQGEEHVVKGRAVYREAAHRGAVRVELVEQGATLARGAPRSRRRSSVRRGPP